MYQQLKFLQACCLSCSPGPASCACCCHTCCGKRSGCKTCYLCVAWGCYFSWIVPFLGAQCLLSEHRERGWLPMLFNHLVCRKRDLRRAMLKQPLSPTSPAPQLDAQFCILDSIVVFSCFRMQGKHVATQLLLRYVPDSLPLYLSKPCSL